MCSRRNYSRWFHSTLSSPKTTGVSIAIHKCLPILPLEHVAGPNGQCKFQLWNKVFTIANLYIQNHEQIMAIMVSSPLDRICRRDYPCRREFQFGIRTPAGHHFYSRLRVLRKQLFEHRFLDLWHTPNPKNRNYTYYSSVHQSYSRLDIFLRDHIYCMESLYGYWVFYWQYTLHTPHVLAFELNSYVRLTLSSGKCGSDSKLYCRPWAWEDFPFHAMGSPEDGAMRNVYTTWSSP